MPGDEPDLTEALARAAADRDADALVGALAELAARLPARVGPALVALGRLAQGDARLHAALCAALVRLPARPPYLLGLRRLFKQAEMADDAGLFAATAHRFETATPMYTRRYRQARVYVPELKTAVQIAQTFGAPDARVGLSEATLLYMKRRIWRTLRKRGDLSDPAFAELACAFLLALRPGDMARQTRWSVPRRNEQGRWITEQRSSGPFARNWTASQLLSRNDPDAKSSYRKLSFSQGGEAREPSRPEAFPDLWAARPDLALALAAGSGCEPVALLGLRVLRAVPAFLADGPADPIARLLAAPLALAQRFGFEQARDRLARGAADPALLVALISADLAEARRLALERIEVTADQPWSDAALALATVTSRHDDVGEAALRWAAARPLADEDGRALATALGVWLAAMPSALDTSTEDLIRAVRARMAALWRSGDMRLAPEAVSRLLAHPAPAVVAAGVDALDLTGLDPASVTDATWRTLLGSDSTEVQAAALRLFGRLGDDQLAAHAPLVTAFATAPSSALRQAARPLVKRLADRDPDLRDRLSRALIDSLFAAAPDDAYPADTVTLLTEALPDRATAIDAGLLWRLLQARAKGAQLLGSTLLPSRAFETFSVRQTARLGNHPHVAARRWAIAAYEARPARFQAEAADAVLLVESDWPDVQAFARRVFEDWPAAAWSPATLAVVADSVKPEVLALARRLLRARLAPADAEAQLVRLLEHPAPSMHLLVTEVLTEQAVAEEAAFERLLGLARIVMLQVGKGRLAKDRMTAFLHAEALRRADRAARIAALFSDLSLSGTARDRAAAILALRDIGDAHPEVATPLARRAVPQKAA